jgi:hypothetical protein
VCHKSLSLAVLQIEALPTAPQEQGLREKRSAYDPKRVAIRDGNALFCFQFYDLSRCRFSIAKFDRKSNITANE